MTDLVAKLLRTFEYGVDADKLVIADLYKGLVYRNPNGPEAAARIETLEAENTALKHDLERCMAREFAALNELGNQPRVRMCEPKDE